MSGTTIPYGDRPITRITPDGGYATPEFLQFLERLGRAHSSNAGDIAGLQPQITANTNAIAAINGEVNNLQILAAAATTTNNQQVGLISDLMQRVPAQTVVVQAGAVALTSGTVAQLTTQGTLAGSYVLLGTVYLTGSGSVTLAQASVGVTAGVIETAPGAFATGWFGGGASPGGLSADLSIGSFAQLVSLVVPSTVYLNVKATCSGTISAYGNLIVWRTGNI